MKQEMHMNILINLINHMNIKFNCWYVKKRKNWNQLSGKSSLFYILVVVKIKKEESRKNDKLRFYFFRKWTNIEYRITHVQFLLSLGSDISYSMP